MSGGGTAARGGDRPGGPRDAVGTLLHGVLRNAVAATGAQWATLCFDDRETGATGLPVRHFRLHSRSSTPRLAPGFPEECRRCALRRRGYRRCSPRPSEVLPLEGGALPCGSNVAVTLGWEPQGTLGVLTFRLSPSRYGGGSPGPCCVTAARRISGQLRRCGVGRRMEEALGRELLLAGTAETLDPVDEFLERASRVELPVVVQGEFGVQKEFVAAALHFAGGDRRRPFVRLDCRCLGLETCEGRLPELLRRGVGGTLFLDGVDDLPFELQAPLSGWLETELGIPTDGTGRPAARLVASCRQALTPLMEAGTFHPALHAQLDWMSVIVPPLRRRQDDIPVLVAYFLHRHGRPELRPSPRALEALLAYRWPGNVAELERTATRLAMNVEEGVVRLGHLERCTPRIAAGAEPAAAGAPVAGLTGPRQSPTALVALASELLEGRFESLGAFHPGLRKALRYIADQGREPLSLRELARRSCLSPSHLSQLFRRSLGLSFKPFLTLYRVELARRLLERDPHASISEVAEAAGFGDLSRLERAFKPLVGCTPRAYRCARRR